MFSDGDGDFGFADKWNLDAYLKNSEGDILKYENKGNGSGIVFHIKDGENSTVPFGFYGWTVENNKYLPTVNVDN